MYSDTGKKPNAIISFGLCNWIDAEGKLLGKKTGFSDTTGLTVIDRFFTVLLGNMNPVLGVMRKVRISEVDILDTVGMDLIILCRLALAGDFIPSYKTSWYRRDFRDEQKYAEKLNRYKSDEYRLSKGFISKYFPLARLPIEIIKQILCSEVPILEKVLILTMLIIVLPVKYISGKYLG